MRTIKFRGLRTDGKGWVYGDLIQKQVDLSWIQPKNEPKSYEVIPESVGQFTGLLDQNGKEIYEGDILSDKSDDPMILPVIYADEHAMFCCDISYDKDGSAIQDIENCYGKDLFVIGNIHEKPIPTI